MPKVHKLNGGNFDFAFFCPGCNCCHGIDSKRWSFNMDMEKPTISPSILVTVGHHPDAPDVCHSFVTDGKIQFLDDCTHPLKGQTVELEEF